MVIKTAKDFFAAVKRFNVRWKATDRRRELRTAKGECPVCAVVNAANGTDFEVAAWTAGKTVSMPGHLIDLIVDGADNGRRDAAKSMRRRLIAAMRRKAA